MVQIYIPQCTGRVSELQTKFPRRPPSLVIAVLPQGQIAKLYLIHIFWGEGGYIFIF